MLFSFRRHRTRPSSHDVQSSMNDGAFQHRPGRPRCGGDRPAPAICERRAAPLASSDPKGLPGISMVVARAPRVTCGDFSLARSTRQLRRGTRELRLEPKAFELLDLLLVRRPAAVSKSEIQVQLWPDSFVSEGSITGLVTQIRQALEDDRARSRFVRTVHGFGYAFSGNAVDVAPPVEERPSALPAYS